MSVCICSSTVCIPLSIYEKIKNMFDTILNGKGLLYGQQCGLLDLCIEGEYFSSGLYECVLYVLCSLD